MQVTFLASSIFQHLDDNFCAQWYFVCNLRKVFAEPTAKGRSRCESPTSLLDIRKRGNFWAQIASVLPVIPRSLLWNVRSICGILGPGVGYYIFGGCNIYSETSSVHCCVRQTCPSLPSSVQNQVSFWTTCIGTTAHFTSQLKSSGNCLWWWFDTPPFQVAPKACWHFVVPDRNEKLSGWTAIAKPCHFETLSWFQYPWASGGRALGNFSKIFLGGGKSYEICFSHSKLWKQPFLPKFSKTKAPLLTPMLVSPVKTWSTSSQSKQHAAVRSCSVLAYGELEILLNQFIDHK